MAIMAKKLQPAKTAAIEETKKILADYTDFIFVDYRGLTVEQITKLRDGLREKGAQLKVFKNTYARIAFQDMKIEGVADYMAGPTAIAMLKEEANEAAKVMFDFTKDAPALKVKGAWVANEVFDAEKIEAYSKLPGKKALIAMLMSAINGPARKLAGTLQALVEKKQSEGDAPAPAADAAPADAAPAAETPAAEAAPAPAAE